MIFDEYGKYTYISVNWFRESRMSSSAKRTHLSFNLVHAFSAWFIWTESCFNLHYPGHLTLTVCFTEKVKGDYILLNGVRYVICAPTYINVSVGVSIPDMGNIRQKLYLLDWVAFSDGTLFVVETALKATAHYQCFTSPACRDYHPILLIPVWYSLSRCRDACCVMCCFIVIYVNRL